MFSWMDIAVGLFIIVLAEDNDDLTDDDQDPSEGNDIQDETLEKK